VAIAENPVVATVYRGKLTRMFLRRGTGVMAVVVMFFDPSEEGTNVWYVLDVGLYVY